MMIAFIVGWIIAMTVLLGVWAVVMLLLIRTGQRLWRSIR